MYPSALTLSFFPSLRLLKILEIHVLKYFHSDSGWNFKAVKINIMGAFHSKWAEYRKCLSAKNKISFSPAPVITSSKHLLSWNLDKTRWSLKLSNLAKAPEVAAFFTFFQMWREEIWKTTKSERFVYLSCFHKLLLLKKATSIQLHVSRSRNYAGPPYRGVMTALFWKAYSEERFAYCVGDANIFIVRLSKRSHAKI
jgi:hypothetical protein